MSHTRIEKNENNLKEATLMERVAGTVPAILVQVGTLHSLDTVAKRIINSKEKNIMIDGVKQAAKKLNNIIFLDMKNAPWLNRYFSLYAGILSGLLYKVLQFTYKFSFQPEVAKFIKKSETDKFASKILPTSLVNPFVQAIAGAITGAFEVIFLPLDMVKIKKQNNPELKKTSSVRIISQEYKSNGLQGLYKSAGITIARNIPGSAALFLFPALVYSYVFRKKKSEASALEQGFANVTGAIGSLACSNPQDVVKIRIQSGHEMKSARHVASNIIQHEGYRAFGKGLGVKLITQVPKLSLVPYLSDEFTRHINNVGLFARKNEQRTIACRHEQEHQARLRS
jgi:hypothetical protein